MGLYGIYFIGPILSIPALGKFNILIYIPLALGLLGLIFVQFHGAPGFHIATYMGLRESRTVVNTNEGLIIDFINGFFGALIYGGVGLVIDLYRKKKLGNKFPHKKVTPLE